MLFKTKGFIEPKGSRRDFEGDFFGIGSTSIRSTVVTGQTEGLKVGCGGMGGRRDGRMGGRRDGVYEAYEVKDKS